MKRKASAAAVSPPQEDDDDDVGRRREPPRAAPRLAVDDGFLVHEILPRLSAHAARPFAAASATFRRVLTDPDYWRSHHPPPPDPHAACLVVRGGGSDGDDGDGDGRFLLHEFHYADADASSPAPAVARAAGGSLAAYRLAGTCDGIVLLTAPWNSRSRASAVVLNPASGADEVTLDLPIDSGGVFHCFCGLGYSPSSRAYKALLCSSVNYGAGRLVDVELTLATLGDGGAGAGERRTVAAVHCRMDGDAVPASLSLDGIVYILVDMGSPGTKVLALDIDHETVTYIEPPPIGRPRSELMEVWGRPCIATSYGYGDTTLFWTLMPDHRGRGWELRGSVTNIVVVPGRKVHGAWDCGNGLLFAVFSDGTGCMYDLQKPAAVLAPPGVDGAALLLPPELRNATFCWGYQPTLVPPATVFGGACPDDQRDGLRQLSNGGPINRPRKSAAVVPLVRRPCLELLMETIRALRAATTA